MPKILVLVLVEGKNSVYRLLVMFFICLFGSSGYSQSVGGTTSGAASYCDTINSGFVSLNGYTGTIFWQSSTDGSSWTNLPNPTPTQSYLNLTQTTYYRAVVQDGAFPADTSTISIITIYIPAEGGTIAGGGTFCQSSGTGTLTLSGEIGTVTNWQFSTDGGVVWTTVPNTTTSLNYPSLTQTTLYAAVVENVVGCPIDTSSFALFTIDPGTVAGVLSQDTTICSGANDNTLTLTGETGSVIDWISSTDGGLTWVSEGIVVGSLINQNLTQTTQYQVIVQSGLCPSDSSNIIELTVVMPDLVDAGNDESIVLHQSVTLNAIGNGTVVWSPSEGLDDSTSTSPQASPISTTTYIVTQTDANGCFSTDTLIVDVFIPIPTAITPNNDNVNDYFYIDKIEEVPSNSLTIFNRHGNMVYDKSPYANEWNGVSNKGKDLPDGIYYFILEYGDGIDPQTGYVLIKR